MRKGKAFENKIQNALKKYGFIYKFRDYAVNPRGAYKVPVPADFMFISKGKVIMLECKEFKKERFYFSNIREAQFKYADEITDNGIPYYFLIHYAPENTLYIVDYAHIHEKMMNGAKSMSLKTLNTFPSLKMGTKYGEKLYNIIMGLNRSLLL